MKIKEIILNLVASTGIVGSFYLGWIKARDASASLAPADGPISQLFSHISPAASFMSYGLIGAAITLTCCSVIAVALKMKIVTNGYGIAFTVPENAEK
ncbi:hypothetical protein [Aliidiomarina quisquiliarum]|uniref:hypothetical protein n=1 Tax=Aliidiomarina quisquiliarum TaxID=2938947 RepID=UPI00208FEAE7|nr:hypothetical protein [Aliidiomarina quisquiliarum]MCO4320029.1 hypothetical protein [Aliidiomarina quisquiliarum]